MTVQKLSRVEIAFTGEGIGAQATFLVGEMIGERFIQTGQRVTGLDAGDNAEYADKLSDVLGEALAGAIAEHTKLNWQIKDAQERQNELAAELAAAKEEVAALQAELSRLTAARPEEPEAAATAEAQPRGEN